MIVWLRSRNFDDGLELDLRAQPGFGKQLVVPLPPAMPEARMRIAGGGLVVIVVLNIIIIKHKKHRRK